MTHRVALPPARSEDDYDEITEDELRPGVVALCRDLGVDATGLERFPIGSLPVYAAGQLVLKLFPQVHAEEYPVEAGVLAAVHGRLPVPTPAVHAVGERDGWGYVLMERLRGIPLDTVWDSLGPADRDGLAAQLGEAMAALHGVTPPAIEDWWPDDWDEFVEQQRTLCAVRHRGLGLDPVWLEQIKPYLDGTDLAGGSPVLLHTEIMRQHLLVSREDARWRFTGLFDFEPAMCGAREYEFVGLGCFVAAGDPRFFGRALRAYGHDGLDGRFRRRMLAWSLLHHYSNMHEWMARLPRPAEPTLESLADAWFATS